MTSKVYVPGTWDVFHYGHVRLLRGAAKYGEVFAGVNSDKWVEERKKTASFLSQRERREVVESCRFVRAAVIVESPFGNILDTLPSDKEGRIPPYNVLDALDPSWIVIGSDWAERMGELEGVEKTKGRMIVFLPYTEAISSTEVRRRLRDRLGERSLCSGAENTDSGEITG